MKERSKPRRPIGSGIIPALLVLCAVVNAHAAQRAPNIVFIMIDDLGWMDLACQGNKAVHTPNIDRLAKQGMRFTDNYAAAPVCSPTRAAILTGRSPARLRITNHLPDQARFIPDQPVLLPAECREHLPLDEVTCAEVLRKHGYATGFVGKWHLAKRAERSHFPEHQGFDLNIGGCSYGGPPTYFDPYRIPTIEDRTPGEYLPDRLVDESIRFIKNNNDRPFFLCLWTYTVHWPMEAPEALLKKYRNHEGPGLNDYRYGAMIEAMDQAIGKLLSAIKQESIENDTLVIFTSDNGAFGGVGDNRPLRKEKGFLYEGGIRVPLIVRWPGVVDANTVCRVPTISMDFFPTLIEVAGAEDSAKNRVDGVSLVPLLRGSDQLDRDGDAIYFHYPNYAFHRQNRLGGAIRRGDYKLIENFDDGSVELYHLPSDIGEQNDLVSKHPRIANELRQQLRQWRRSVNAAMPRKAK